MENIPGLIFVYGASVVASIAMILDLTKRYRPKANFKWITITILSLFQVGCWRALSSFGGAFGNSTGFALYEVLFLMLFGAWGLIQIIKHHKQ